MRSGNRAAIFMLVLLFVLIAGRAMAAGPEPIPRPTGDVYVQDHANILNPNEEAQAIQLGRTVEDRTTNQAAILTVQTIGNESIEEYANRAYRELGLGTKEKDNGVLLVLAMKEKKIRIETGYGLEGELPDGRAGRIIDENALPSLKAGRPNEAVIKTYGAIADVISGGTGTDDAAADQKGSGIPDWLFILIVIAFVFIDITFFGGTLTFFLFSLIGRGGGGRGGPRGGGGGSSGGGGASRGW
ncbi:TPM domain-containing protein [Peribacillus sp. SCS-37]|uniref:TPM domain-containing protein n=1 Tax=Paraperibacillus esterisolvens TaxID=3115296 RepID=UPI0039062CE5